MQPKVTGASGQRYWATAPETEIAGEMLAQYTAYEMFLVQSGWLDRMRTSYNAYYGLDKDGSLRLKKRDGGAESKISVNQFRSLMRNTYLLVIQNKLAFNSIARNSDSRSQIQASFSNGLLEYYNTEKDLGKVMRGAVEAGLIESESLVEAPWNKMKGYDIRPDETSNVMKTGDQDYIVRSPRHVARETAVAESNWWIVKESVNKWDLAARFPAQAEYIKSCSIDETTLLGYQDSFGFTSSITNKDDLCTTYRLYHARTPAVEEGRETLVIGDQWLSDGPLTYKRPPIYRFSAGKMFDSTCSHSIAFDLLAIQQALDILLSAALSNNLNFAKQNIWSPDPNLSQKTLSDGMRLVTSSIKPEALQLTQSSPELYKMLELLMTNAQEISAINNTVRGNPEASLKSGNSLALMLATAIQFVAETQAAYAELAGQVASQTIENIQSKATEPMLATIGGKSKKAYIREFKSTSVKDIVRVTCEIGNALSQTAAGRQELATLWVNNGWIKNPQEMISVLETGNTDGLTEGTFDENICIRRENEEIREGINPPVMLTDKHAFHILQHMEVFSDPAVRYDPVITKAGLDHIQTHLDQDKLVPPELRAIMTGQPMPPPVQGEPQQSDDEVPEIAGVNIPTVPPGTPPQAAAAYGQVESQVSQMPQVQGF